MVVLCFSYSGSLLVPTMPENSPISPLRSEDDVNFYGFAPLTISFHLKRLGCESLAASSPHFPFTGKLAEELLLVSALFGLKEYQCLAASYFSSAWCQDHMPRPILLR